jgi:hypothetical protein
MWTEMGLLTKLKQFRDEGIPITEYGYFEQSLLDGVPLIIELLEHSRPTIEALHEARHSGRKSGLKEAADACYVMHLELVHQAHHANGVQRASELDGLSIGALNCYRKVSALLEESQQPKQEAA